MQLRRLVGSGDRIALVTLPFLLIGLILNLANPSLFGVGGPGPALRAASIAILVPGLLVWAWSALLILTTARNGQLITGGPYRVVKHPLYVAVALLVLPWIGFLLDTWLGLLVGVVLYLGARRFEGEEEATLSRTFGGAWDDYCATVKLPWL